MTRHLFELLVILIVGASLVSAGADCYATPNITECEHFKMPDNLIHEDLAENCNARSGMPNMASCSLDRICQAEKNLIDGPYCTPFSLLKGVCLAMPNMPGCDHYRPLCRDDTLVHQCSTKVFPLPSGSSLRQNVNSICTEMYMVGCEKCMTNNGIYSELCAQMPGMKQCGDWKSYCKFAPNWAICGGDGQSAEFTLDQCCLNSFQLIVGNAPPPMRMYWHFSYEDYVLFQDIVPRNWWQYWITWAVCCFFAIGYEGLKAGISQLEQHWTNSVYTTNLDGASLLGSTNSKTMAVPPFNLVRDLIRASLHLVYMGLHYWIMLVAMTFNVGLFFAILAGHFIGYFFFGRYSRLQQVENCCA